MNLEPDSSYKDYNLTKVAWYYYIEGLTQQNIAKLMGVSRITVNKMLEEARQKNLVQFNVPLQYYSRLKVEQQLRDKYNLDDVLIIPFFEKTNLNESLGKAAASYLTEFLGNDAYINMGYGDTLHHLINNFATKSDNLVSIISLTGGVSPYLPLYTSTNLKISLNLIPAPLFMNNETTAKNILLEKSVQEIYELADLASVTVTGIGEVSENSTIVSSGIVNPNTIQKLRMKGAVADILMHFIDKDGNIIESEIEKRLVSTSLSKLKQFKNTIAVAGGEHKVIAINAAMKTGIFNRLITDELTAQKLLEEAL